MMANSEQFITIQKLVKIRDIDKIKEQLEGKNLQEFCIGTKSLLFLATEAKNYELMQVLIDMGANPNEGGLGVHPYVHCTFIKIDVIAFEIFLSTSAALPIDDYGYTCAHLAALEKNAIMLRLVLEKHPILAKHKTTKKYNRIASGSTPLHVAVSKKCMDCVEVLLEFGASFYGSNDDHQFVSELPQARDLIDYWCEDEDFIFKYIYELNYRKSIPSEKSNIEFASLMKKVLKHLEFVEEEPAVYQSVLVAQKSIVDRIDHVLRKFLIDLRSLIKETDKMERLNKDFKKTFKTAPITDTKAKAVAFIKAYDLYKQKYEEINITGVDALPGRPLNIAGVLMRNLRHPDPDNNLYVDTQKFIDTMKYFNPEERKEIEERFVVKPVDNLQFLRDYEIFMTKINHHFLDRQQRLCTHLFKVFSGSKHFLKTNKF